MISLIILGVLIGFNNFAVALTLGAMGQAPYRYRMMFVFGVFHCRKTDFCYLGMRVTAVKAIVMSSGGGGGMGRFSPYLALGAYKITSNKSHSRRFRQIMAADTSRGQDRTPLVRPMDSGDFHI